MTPADYAACDAIELAARIAANLCTAEEALEAACSVVARLDGPINAFVSLEKEIALASARERSQGPLTGVPIAMKDCVGYVGGASRNFGSRLRPGVRPERDDEVVRRYRAAGLVPFGTTNVPELSSCLTTESRLHGPCRNPWNLAHSTGGSSGGAAAAVAYGAVPVAYGNDSAGSIRVPASCCGVFGFRPGRGRVPTGPLYGEIWYGLLSHHVITRSVRDSALILDLSEGVDAGAPYSAPPKVRSYLEECSFPPAPLRIAVSDGVAQGFAVDPDCARALATTAARLQSLGHRVEPASPDCSGAAILDTVTMLLSIAVAEELPLLALQAGRPIGPDTVESSLRALLERGEVASAVQMSRALTCRDQLGRALGRFLDRYDLLLTPTLARLPPTLGWIDADSADLDEFLERMWRFSPFAPLANLAGAPSMSVPLEHSRSGLPIGLMFTAPQGGEGTLFSLAAELERAFPWKDSHPPHGAWAIMRPG